MALAPLFGVKHRPRSRAVQCFWVAGHRAPLPMRCGKWRSGASNAWAAALVKSAALIKSYELNETRPIARPSLGMQVYVPKGVAKWDFSSVAPLANFAKCLT